MSRGLTTRRAFNLSWIGVSNAADTGLLLSIQIGKKTGRSGRISSNLSVREIITKGGGVVLGAEDTGRDRPKLDVPWNCGFGAPLFVAVADVDSIARNNRHAPFTHAADGRGVAFILVATTDMSHHRHSRHRDQRPPIQSTRPLHELAISSHTQKRKKGSGSQSI